MGFPLDPALYTGFVCTFPTIFSVFSSPQIDKPYSKLACCNSVKVTFPRFLLHSPWILERLLLQLSSRSNKVQEIEQSFCVILSAGASALLLELIDPDIEHSGHTGRVQLNHMHGIINAILACMAL